MRQMHANALLGESAVKNMICHENNVLNTSAEIVRVCQAGNNQYWVNDCSFGGSSSVIFMSVLALRL